MEALHRVSSWLSPCAFPLASLSFSRSFGVASTTMIDFESRSNQTFNSDPQILSLVHIVEPSLPNCCFRANRKLYRRISTNRALNTLFLLIISYSLRISNNAIKTRSELSPRRKICIFRTRELSPSWSTLPKINSLSEKKSLKARCKYLNEGISLASFYKTDASKLRNLSRIYINVRDVRDANDWKFKHRRMKKKLMFSH